MRGDVHRCILAVLLVLFFIDTNPVLAEDDEARISDPDTIFHRLYVLGNGDNSSEDRQFRDDLDELREDLETEQNQANGSTSQTLVRPTRQQLMNAIQRLQQTAQDGEEVTFFFSGHGGNRYVDQQGNTINDPAVTDPNGDETDRVDEFIRIRAGDIVTDDEIAAMLTGFANGVTLVTVFDTCWGGGFTSGTTDIQETDSTAVVGAATACPIDNWTGAWETLTEAVADKAGQREADANGDGIVTADELKTGLGRQSPNPLGLGPNWQLGPPEDRPESEKKPKFGKSKCSGGDGCSQPLPVNEGMVPYRAVGGGKFVADGLTSLLRFDIHGESVSRVIDAPERLTDLNGEEFTPLSSVEILLVASDLSTEFLDVVSTDSVGTFSTQVQPTVTAPGRYLLYAIDEESNQDWVELGIDTVRRVVLATRNITGIFRAYDFASRTLIELDSFALVGVEQNDQGTVLRGEGTASVNGVTTEVEFGVAGTIGEISYSVSVRDSGETLAAGFGEAGRSAFSVAISP